MAYNHEVSMANMDNVIEALNEGGMLSCEDIATRSWNNATALQRDQKISAPDNVLYHTELYASKQVRQEVRRTLYNYFNDTEESPYDIYRATAHGDVERFWVSENQGVTVEVTGGAYGDDEDPNIINVTVGALPHDYPAAANIYEALTEARAMLESEFIGRAATTELRHQFDNRIQSIISELGANACLA